MLLDVDTNERHNAINIRSDEDSIIVTLPAPMPSNAYKRISKIGSNCPELANKNIYVLRTSNSYYASVEDNIRLVTSIVSSLKTVKEVEFNIKTIEYDDFIETYSASSKTDKRIKNTDTTPVDKQIRFNHYDIQLPVGTSSSKRSCFTSATTVSNIKSWYSDANTIVVVKSDNKSFWDRATRVFMSDADPIPKSKNILYEVFLMLL